LLGWATFLTGFLIEAVADAQKYVCVRMCGPRTRAVPDGVYEEGRCRRRFGGNPANKGKWIEEGLWRYGCMADGEKERDTYTHLCVALTQGRRGTHYGG
jgi:steroid 5-alpha reductase family enzyme